MIPEAREVRLRPKIRKVLEARCRAPSTPQGEVKRARIVLLAAEGRSTRSIGQEVDVQPRIVSKWRHRFADHGLGGLADQPRAARPSTYGQATNKRYSILAQIGHRNGLVPPITRSTVRLIMVLICHSSLFDRNLILQNLALS